MDGVSVLEYLFPCSPEISHFAIVFRKIKTWISYVPCSENCLCSHVSLNFRPLFPYSPEINALILLFLKTSVRASLLVTRHATPSNINSSRYWVVVLFCLNPFLCACAS